MTLHSFPGDLVFDPWSGSGTTVVVAERLGRRWIACEIQEDFCDMSIPRISGAAAQTALSIL